ncbi:dipeptidase PepV [Companilactobacillus sp.]|jgi:dipeptidase PepV|uniref:dipeptidase PepV n=1 Tax=Companilactobacillus sp. TaxID=2767905 RepID=UPI0025C5B064|nr:dipeptidase PepV [Companilactobacillus sp.]MCH4010318.1 dipeptidase PepV [Companilactobacillus sp.]MCH4052006.1 dipeptidase PepV [Companilactobacillus sp.]MCH4078260.1 dipeptidase PepV [Companilactobacillus sp.]MCH4126836.1 dipeptidase PepV [Companilactobacillus sp.]MCH4132675.1 dipeptidase PepV [Companilactobacillus sp.]
MSIDWEKEVSHRSDELLNDLSELLSIDSSRDIEHKTDDYPLGPGPAKALKTFLHFAERDDFKTKNVDNLAGRIELGDSEDKIAILGHVDVVPEGPGWETNAFEPTIKDGNIYARGTSDDKGPSLAAYYALKIIKELNLPTSKSVHMILGTDEESEWVGMNHYMEKETMPETGFSPDAEFPVINGEKGIVSFAVEFPQSKNGIVKNFDSGLRPNMVPQHAEATIVDNDGNLNSITNDFNDFVNDNDEINGEITLKANTYSLKMIGKGSHAMEPYHGVNAATYLAKFIATLPLNNAEQTYFNFIADQLFLDHYGKNLHIDNHDDVMGDLTVSPDIFKFDDNHASILLNIRYPKGDTGETLTDKINKQLPENVTASIEGHNQLPHFVDANDPLVQSLMGAYQAHTDDLESKPFTVGGGTYGRILKNGVAFGAMFPGDENVMHQANEYINLDKLFKATAIYADAIYRLIK